MPKVSIIVPCYNEEATIRFLLQAILDQTYPTNEIELIIADGFSTDQTRKKIEDFRKQNPVLVIKLVDNPKRIIPAGLNQALFASEGEYIIRFDAHSVPSTDYVERCILQLSHCVADNVGGVWDIQPGGAHWVARSIAAAAAHPIGAGDARYRYSTQAGFVDTVPFGSFKRETFEKVGYYNENLPTNEDYEFNVRIKANGGRIFFDPQIKSIYFARSSFLALARQYWRYGFWKYRMLMMYPSTLRWRQALPPVFVAGILGMVLLSPFWAIVRLLLLFVLCFYGLVLIFSTVPKVIEKRDLPILIGIPLAVALMHLCWGAGFLFSMVKSFIRG